MSGALATLAEDKAAADGLLFACVEYGRKPDFTGCGGPVAEAFWGRFTTERMLAEVEAKRRVLATHSDDGRGWCRGCPVDRAGDPDYTIYECPERRDIAATWSRHPDYQESWKP